MNEGQTTTEVLQRFEQNGHIESPQLVERMDSAIGDASASIGLVMAELVRRSLRGGVGEISNSIHDFARDQVGTAIGRMMPTVTLTVEQLAEATSKRVTEGAVHRFEEELKSVETRATEHTHVIAARVKAEAEAAVDAVHQVVLKSSETAESTARELEELQQRAKESWKKVKTELQTLREGRSLTDLQLSETREQLNGTREQVSGLLQTLSHTGQELLETRTQLNQTTQQLAESRKLLVQSQHELAQTRQELSLTQQQLGEARSGLSELSRTSAQKISGLEAVLTTVTERLSELERPKGIRALLTRFKGGQKKQAGQIESAEIDSAELSEDSTR